MTVAIIDYGMGNLFSVKQACLHAGMEAVITNDRRVVESASGLILPGVGAYGKAMRTLHELGLAESIANAAAANKPLMGICLGMQLLMSKSYEFGEHAGLGVIEGEVVRFEHSDSAGERVKIPQVGWNRIQKVPTAQSEMLEEVDENAYMYFVHSYYVRPADPSITVTSSSYGGVAFCSSLSKGSIFACQFHPERSGEQGLQLYRNFARKFSLSLTEGLNV